jgi:hypothetical protein
MAELRKTWRFIALLALGAAFGWGCGEGVPLVSPEGSTLTISANPTSIPLVGGESTITVIGFRSAADGGGTLPNGTQIFFSTTLGVIEERVTMQSGVARATLRSNGRAGTATVTATSGQGVSQTTEVRIGLAGEGVRIVLTANPTTVVSPDFTSELVATAFDDGNNPLRDVPIIFTTTAGVLASRGSIIRTNANGQAVDRLTLVNESSATVTAISGAVSSNAVTVSRGTLVEPILTSVSPFVGAPGQSLIVTIDGLNFQPGATASFGTGISVTAVDFVSSSTLRARISISPGASEGPRTVTVTNPDGGSGTLEDGFLVSTTGGGGGGGLTPTVTSVSPTSANQGATLTLTITGMNFQTGAQVSFTPGGIVVNSVNVVSATQIQANISVSMSAAAGDRDVTVVNPGGASDTLASAFLVIAPPIVNVVTPSSGNVGQTIVAVEINGQNFQSGAAVAFGAGITVSPPLFIDPTTLFVDITISGAAVPGPRTVTVTNPDGGTGSRAGAFTVN